jgi:lipoyl(octanoyl) transferase
MAACSSAAAAVGATLRPVLWSHIPYHVPYTLGLALQERLVARRFEARAQLAELPAPSPASRVAAAVAPASSSTSAQALQRISETDTLLLLEHTPVYTEGRRKGAREAVGDDAERQRLEKLGADYLVTQRGGQITYHGPGQLVGYPIWDLAAMQVSAAP